MAASSIVVELQRMATDPTVSTSELLRLGLVVATKLRIEEFRIWIKDELSGYVNNGVPEYRIVKGMVVATHVIRGTMKLPFERGEDEHRFSEVPIDSSVAELESHIRSKGPLHVFFPPAIQDIFQKHLSPGMRNPHVMIGTGSLTGIIDNVRNRVLEWALKLETEGILGEGMSFSDQEKQKAAQTPSIHIGGNFHGVLGNVTGENVQIGDYGVIHQQLKDAGVAQAERNELENIMDELKKAKPEEKKSWAQKGMDWLGKNAGNLGSIAGAIRNFFAPHLPPGQE